MSDVSTLTPAAGLLRIESWRDKAYHKFYRETPALAQHDPEATWAYRIETDLRGPIKSLACDIRITGRTVQAWLSSWFIACRVTFPAYDGQPAVTVPAKLFLSQPIAQEFAAILAGQIDADTLAYVAKSYAADNWIP